MIAATLPIAASTVTPTVIAADAATDLFISEYVEGSSFNKAIEIYNGTGAAVDLSAYTLSLYSNGASAASQITALSGTLADGDVHVIAHPDAVAVVLALADAISPAVVNFNGDDAVELSGPGGTVDVIGQIGVDPGTQWSAGGVSTLNTTIRRGSAICAGDPDGSDAFDPSAEWVGFAQDAFDGLGSHTADCGDSEPATPVINEFSVSTAGTDTEYVEIFGEASTDYSSLTVLEIEGDSNSAIGMIDEVIAVGATGTDGLYVASLVANTLENGSVTLLLVDGFTGLPGDDLDTDDDGVIDVTPWASLVDGVAVHDGGTDDVTYAVELGVSYDGLPFAPGGASRLPDGVDTDTTADWVRNDFDLVGIPGFVGTPELGEAANTPGAPNAIVVVPEPVCGDPVTFIHEIQGDGPSSPMIGETVSIEAVVVGDFQDTVGAHGDLNGFHVQEEDADADADTATSEGVFVFQGSNPSVDVTVGDHVRVTGAVSEFNGLTEISTGTVLVCGPADAPTPATITLPAASIDDLEAFEGMSIVIPQSLTIAEYFNFDRFNEIVLTTDRQFQPTGVFEPGSPEAAALADANRRSRIVLDDGRSSQNSDPARHPNGAEFTLANGFRGGDLVSNVVGVLDFAFDLYRVQPTAGAAFTAVNPRPTAAPAVGGDIQVASFNVLNYFNTPDDGVNDICGPLQNLECRGADDEIERVRQLDKIVDAMRLLDADVLGIIEVENTLGVEAMADIVDGLNALVGPGTYAYVDTGLVGTDAIKVGLIYQPGSVTPLGDFAVLDDPAFVAPFGEDRNRAALAQTFADNATGGAFTVAVNHLKSKGSACGPGDDDPEAGSCNLTRTVSAQVLADWLAGDPTGSGDPDVLIVGDLNSYDHEDPIDTLEAAGYTDLLGAYQGENAYSYVFGGVLGYLDYAMANASLSSQITGTAAWNINADEADILDYDTSFKQDAQDALYEPNAYRSSDHDPVIVGIDPCDDVAPEIRVRLSRRRLTPANHRYVRVNAFVHAWDNLDDDPTITLVSVTSDEPDNGAGDGNTVNDIVILDDDSFLLRAERSAFGDGRTYTVTYQAEDSCGNVATAEATVEVPRWSWPWWRFGWY
jgi:predicted extracellular nuclease